MTADERRPPSGLRRDDVLTTVRTVLFGSTRGDSQRARLIGLAVGSFALTFIAYYFDIFSHSGGVVFIPYHASIVGVIAAFWTGYGRNGVLRGWLLTSLSFLGWHAAWATEISPRPLLERVAYILRPDGLVVLATFGLGVAVLGFTVGVLVRTGVESFRGGARTAADS
jgi:hypothetical protein